MPDPRSNRYLQHFRGVRHFSQSPEKYKKDIQKPTKMTPKIKPKASQNAFKNEDKKQHEKLTILAPKMDPKWSQNGRKISGASFPRGIRKRFGNTDSFFCGFGVPLDPFWHPFRRLLGILGAFRPPSGSLLASLRLSFRQPLEAFRSAENLPRFRRELAEIQPRTCRGSAENPPRTNQDPAV